MEDVMLSHDRAVESHPTVDSTQFRRVFGMLPTSVAVIGTHTPGGPAGMTVGTLSSVSLDPPLVGFMPRHDASMVARIGDADGMFSASILSSKQAVQAREMSARDRREGDGEWVESPRGLPILAGSIAWIEAKVEAIHDAGDHKLVIARVLDLSDHEPGHPLVFYRGEFHALGEK